MKCRKCHTDLPEGSKYCLCCGAKQNITKNPKSRGNGQGSVYKLPNGSWIAVKTFNLHDENGKIKKNTRSKSGFKTKKEAVAYLPFLTETRRKKKMTFKQVYDAWKPTHKAGRSTMNCYNAAFNYFKPVWYMNIDEITIDDLQACMDECTKSKRTHEDMKTVCGLIYKFAIPRHLVTLNMGQYLIVDGTNRIEKGALPTEYIKEIEKHIDDIPGAAHIICQCYLGFRPSELLELKVDSYNEKEKAFVGGIKTDAGKNRTVTISPKIQPIIDNLLAGKKSGQIFCHPSGKVMDIVAYRDLFYEVLEKCGLENPIIEVDGANYHKYTPHSCRHSFATMMKRVPGADKDKLELIGHTDTEMLRHYEDVSYEDLRKITDRL